MFEIEGQIYFINLTAIDKVLNLNNTSNPTGGMVKETDTKEIKGVDGELISSEINVREFYKSKEVDSFRYNMIQNMIEIIMLDGPQDGDDIDEANGGSKDDQAYKIAFNTLLMYGIVDVYTKKK